MTLNRKSIASVAGAVIAGALLAPAIASADGHGHKPPPIPVQGTPEQASKDAPHPHVFRLPESPYKDILDIPDHAKLPDLSHLPDFNDFHHHYKKDTKSDGPVLVEKVYPPEPIQYPPSAQTDSIAPPESETGTIVALALSAVAILGAAGYAVRRASSR